MLAKKQPPFKKCVTAYWSSNFAPIMIGSKHVAEAVDLLARASGRRALYVRYKPDGNDGSRGVQVIMPE
jgi:hypothetical protein